MTKKIQLLKPINYFLWFLRLLNGDIENICFLTLLIKLLTTNVWFVHNLVCKITNPSSG